MELCGIKSNWSSQKTEKLLLSFITIRIRVPAQLPSPETGIRKCAEGVGNVKKQDKKASHE